MSLQNTETAKWVSLHLLQLFADSRTTVFCKGYELNLHSEEFFKAAEFNRKEMSQLPSAHDRVRSPGNDESNHVDHWHLQSFHHLWLWLWLWWWFWFWWRSVPSSLVDLRSPGGLRTRESVAAGFSVQSHCCHHSQLDFHVTEQNPMAKYYANSGSSTSESNWSATILARLSNPFTCERWETNHVLADTSSTGLIKPTLNQPTL